MFESLYYRPTFFYSARAFQWAYICPSSSKFNFTQLSQLRPIISLTINAINLKTILWYSTHSQLSNEYMQDPTSPNFIFRDFWDSAEGYLHYLPTKKMKDWTYHSVVKSKTLHTQQKLCGSPRKSADIRGHPPRGICGNPPRAADPGPGEVPHF